MRRNGFTLIETIVVMILVGLLASIGGMAIVSGTRSYLAARESAELSTEAQLAMDRLSREIVELVDIPATSDHDTIVVQNVDGTRSIGLVGNQILIAAGQGGPAGGDVLIGGVTAFNLNYWKGAANQTGWTAMEEIRELSAIDLSLTLTGDAGTTQTFTVRAVPRNNENRGGAAPSSTPPTLGNYNVCSVVTAFGDDDPGDPGHPVNVLREFRDKWLQPWAPGRALTRLYYRLSPPLSAYLEGSETARAAARAVLRPVAAALDTAMHGGNGFWAALVSCAALPALFRARRRIFRQGGGAMCRLICEPASQRGAVLMTIIATILLFGLFTAALLPLFTGTKLSNVFSVIGDQAYYLAESGYRVAASEFLNAADDDARKAALANMDGRTYTLSGGDGSFELHVTPYWFEVTTAQASGSNTLSATAFGTPPPAATFSSGGRLRVGTTSVVYAYSGATVSGSTVTFNLSSPLTAAIPTDTDIYLSARSSGSQSVAEEGDMTLTSGWGSWPEVNGMFTLYQAGVHDGRTAYVYRTRTGSTLHNVRLAEGQTATWSNLALTSSTEVTLEPFVRLRSIGITSGNDRREVIYNVPIGWMLATGGFSKEQYQDGFDNLNNWFTGGSDEGHLGGHRSFSIDGGNALDITSTATTATSALQFLFNSLTGAGEWATLVFNSGNTNINMAQSWADAGGFLSYDLQVKVYANGLKYFFAGPIFRFHNINTDDGTTSNDDVEGIGVSFIKARQYSGLLSLFTWVLTGDIPRGVIPGYVDIDHPGPLFNNNNSNLEAEGIFTRYRYSRPAIVLWQRQGGDFNWLAYKILDTTSGNVVTSSNNPPRYRLNGWPTLLVSLVEGESLPFGSGGASSGGKPIKYNDFVETTAGSSARAIGTPIVSSGWWNLGGAVGNLVLTNIDEPDLASRFASGNQLQVDGTTHATATNVLNTTKSNYIRVYYSDSGTSTNGDTQPLNIPRRSNKRVTNTFPQIKWPPDDLTDWSGTSDYFTLVQWDAVNTSVSGVSSLAQVVNGTTAVNAVVKTTSSSFTTPSLDHPENLKDSIALIASGDTADDVSFDDFGMQVDLRGGLGFLPPIQQ